ncbi:MULTISPECIES: fructosamine kinase family protein [Cyanophyceae]|uniref:fructosamine kinase family protein n=1 Tax=Cyanophyceae TaxID=3028117 RepID=UPI0016896E10|nr:fructosamine kinase family protein [Trichocoleus sp. FACHB-40]MBD2006311.1 fructosamine kinase family protein [Trichocoleus sp. FACHB-40]
MWTQIDARITHLTGEKFLASQQRSVSGGCINQGYAISDGQRTYFVKLNQASLVDMFEAEALGLQQMLETNSIRVPKPICWGTEGNSAYLVLEWLELGRGNTQSWEKMGQQLAAMHHWVGKDAFGWDRNNTIGSTPQINTWTAAWGEFYVEHRLGYQFGRALRRGGHFPNQERLLEAIPELLADRQPQPSLVHGDLWGGNASCTVEGEPVIFDPAAYYGDREVDIAMTELFGGFPTAFYRGYNEVFPLDPGYERRKPLYNLYHILNHFNLFGGGYASQASGMIEQILRSI